MFNILSKISLLLIILNMHILNFINRLKSVNSALCFHCKWVVGCLVGVNLENYFIGFTLRFKNLTKYLMMDLELDKKLS